MTDDPNAAPMEGEREAMLRLLIESVHDYGIFLLDLEGRIASWNAGAARINGYSEADVLGRHFSLFYTHEDVTRHYPQYELDVAARTGRIEEEGWRVRKDGSHFWANVVITALRDRQGRLIGFGKVTRDDTERKQAAVAREDLLERERTARREAEELAREVQDQAAFLQEQTAEMEILNEEVIASQTRLQATIDSSLDANVTTDAASIILEWNHHAESIFGWSAAEAVGRSLSETIIPPQHRQAHQRGIEHYLATGEGPILRQRIEITALRRDGTEFPVELTVAPAGSGKQVIFISFIRDLSTRKRAERQRTAEHAVTRVLAESHTLPEAAPRVLRAMGEALGWPVGTFWVVDDDAGVLRPLAFWHAAHVQADALENSTRQITLAAGVGLPGRVWERRAPVWIANIEAEGNFPRAAAALEDGWHGAFGFPLFAGDECLGVVEFFHHAVGEPDAALLQSVEAIGRDIAQAVQRVRAETELDRVLAQIRKTAAERDAVLRQIAEGVIFTDPHGRIVFVNEVARQMHGVSHLAVEVDQYTDAYQLFTLDGHPYPPQQLPLARAVQHDETVFNEEWRIRRPDGTDVIARGSATPVIDETGHKLGAVLTLRDVTEEQRLRRELETERARLHEIFVQAPALISVTEGPEHRIVLANPAYQRTAGGRELVGRTIREAFPELAGHGFFEMRDRVYATGEPHMQNEARLQADLNGDGRLEEHFLNFLTQPLRDARGHVSGMLTFAVDVSAQVRARRTVEEQTAELEAQSRQLQEQATQVEEAQADLEASNLELRQANEALLAQQQEAERARAEAEAANRAKSDFLANMSHELRTPINAVVGYADLMDLGIPDPVTDAQREQLGRIRASSQHLLMLIEDVLDFAKIEAGRVEVTRKATQTADPVNAALALIGPQAAERKLEITAHCEGDADRLFLGDGDRVRQIVVNLLSNAVKFTQPGGTISVACEAVEGRQPGRRSRREKSWVCVHVRDNGIGIAPERQHAVFEPFVQVETERARNRGGTGLGLSISRQLARLMGGDLTLHSEVGEGSRFTLWLLAAPKAPLSATTHPEEE